MAWKEYSSWFLFLEYGLLTDRSRFPNLSISFRLSTSIATLGLEEPQNTVAINSFRESHPWTALECHEIFMRLQNSSIKKPHCKITKPVSQSVGINLTGLKVLRKDMVEVSSQHKQKRVLK
ncbi:hypothetical protein BT93_C1682 [Corymbia citriodora subsp. variegata]|nr:hypothetical protein BT93_C1682 [Corymbia citriodora subsp. variegata]